jgi:N-acetylglucosaminyldiphosphoundecaprenol N-acetyl-beta-D-mannosaminyltransferase
MAMHPDFNREVHCLLGLPFDALNLTSAVQHIRTAATNRTPCFLSTPNLNFLIASQSDTAFRNSVINSDLSIADGMPIIWIARLLGIPIPERVAGSDLFAQLKEESSSQLSIYFYGGMEGVAETACNQLNSVQSGLVCAGFESPGFSSIHEMSSYEGIAKINASGADFLVVSLGAKKGQAWIEHNREQITVPVISHLGAVVNFVAGKLSRAPTWIQRSGLEWLWRIKEEPGLWRRYTSDGVALIKLLFTRVIPYAWFMYRHKTASQKPDSAAIELLENGGEINIRLSGAWVQNNLRPLRECFSNPRLAGKDIRVELEFVTYGDSAFIGLLMLLYGDRKRHGKRLIVSNLNKTVRKIFRYTCGEYLLEAQ